MYKQLEKYKENKSTQVINSVGQKKSREKKSFGFVDNQLETVAKRKQRALVRSCLEVSKLKHLQGMDDHNLQVKMIPASALKAAAQFKSGEANLQNISNNTFQLKKLTAGQELELPELKEEVDVLCEGFTEDKEEFMHAIKSPYNTNLEGGGDLNEEIEIWLPKFDTFFRKLAMIPERAKTSKASFTRLKKQLSLWNNSLRDEYYENVDNFWNTYRARKSADTELISKERNELNQITEADERYFRWYLNQNKSPLSVYRGDGRGVNRNSLEAFQFTDIPAGGTRDISFRGVVEHTHTNSLKNGMVSTTSDFDGAHFWATQKHNYGIVYEMRPANYIEVTDLLKARNFKERYPGQFEVLVPGDIPASDVVSATLYQKDNEVEKVEN